MRQCRRTRSTGLTGSRPLVGRFLVTVIITYCVANTLSWIASDDFKQTKEEARSRLGELRKEQEKARKTKQQSDHWKKQHANISKASVVGNATANDDESQIIHVTVPLWFRERKRRPFTLKDREWQDAKEVIADKQKLDFLKTKTAQTVMAGMRMRPGLHHWLHVIQFDGRVGVEFDVAPPMFTPVQYEVPCIFIKPHEVKWGWRPISDRGGGRLERTFHPIIFTKAFYAGLKTFTLTSFSITASRIKKTFTSPSELRVEVNAKKPETAQAKSQPESAVSGKQAKDQQSSIQTKSSEVSNSASFYMPQSKAFSWKAHQSRAESMTYQEALNSARKVFKQQWIMRQVLAVQKQTPGLITMTGTMVCEGKKGKLRMSVTAFYSPSEKAFVGVPVVTNHFVIPNFSQWEQTGRQKTVAPQPPQSPPPANTAPEKEAVQPAPSGEATRPPPDEKTK